MPDTLIPIRQYADTAANLAAANPVPLNRQLVIEKDKGRAKLGDGVTAYNSLPYIFGAPGTGISGSVANYAGLPAPGTATGEFWAVLGNQGTSWLPGPLGGTYYSAGVYYSTGTSWTYVGSAPYQASQTDVDAGVINDQFITPATLANSAQWNTKVSSVTGPAVDNTDPLNPVVTLPTNLTFYSTTAAADVAGYNKLVIDINDVDYDDPAVDVSTGAITGLAQPVGVLISSAGVFAGNPGTINIATIGEIRRTSGTGVAEFYFEIYQRDSLGTETLVATSNATAPVNVGVYTQFTATALLNNGTWLTTDRVVLKYYGNRIPGGSDPTYEFSFGGGNPVRTQFPVSASLLLNVPIAIGITGVTGGTSGSALTVSPTGLLSQLANPTSGTGTSGQVAYWNGTTTQTGSNNLFWDAANNRLGIGTNTPQVPLNVAKNDEGILQVFVDHTAVGTTSNGSTSLFTIRSNKGNSALRVYASGWGNTSIASTNYAGSADVPLLFTSWNGNVSSSSVTFSYTNFVANGGAVYLGSGIVGGGSRVTITGTGTTSATSTLAMRDSAGTVNFRLKDDGSIEIGKNASGTTQSTASITVTSADTNTGLALVPKGSGAITADIPDGTAVGGNARGTNAVDLQTVRNNASQVASGNRAAIFGGYENTASGTVAATVVGGQQNSVSGATSRSTIIGGQSNGISTFGTDDSIICAGSGNSVSKRRSAVLAGQNNSAAGLNSAVLAGRNNTTSNDYSIAGGSYNIASGARSISLGGEGNQATALFSAAFGGNLNRAQGTASVVIGGGQDPGGGNTASGTRSGVFTGLGNTANATYATVIGGARGLANLESQVATSSGSFSGTDTGDAQTSNIRYRHAITGTSKAELFLDGASVRGILALPTGATNARLWNAKIQVSAICTDGGDGTVTAGEAFIGNYAVGISRIGTTTSLIGTVQNLHTPQTSTNMADAVVDITADDTNEALKIEFTPPTTAGSTTVIRVVATVYLTEVGY